MLEDETIFQSGRYNIPRNIPITDAAWRLVIAVGKINNTSNLDLLMIHRIIRDVFTKLLGSVFLDLGLLLLLYKCGLRERE